MEHSNAFVYNYSASANKEVLEIRKKYMPQAESKLEELKRLDRCVQSAGMMESLSVGILGCLIFGLGMCMGLEVLGGGMVPAVLLGIVGAAVMIFAYPVHLRQSKRMKEKHAPRILELADELTSMKNSETK